MSVDNSQGPNEDYSFFDDEFKQADSGLFALEQSNGRSAFGTVASANVFRGFLEQHHDVVSSVDAESARVRRGDYVIVAGLVENNDGVDRYTTFVPNNVEPVTANTRSVGDVRSFTDQMVLSLGASYR